MNHSLFARCKLNKCTELFDAYNLSGKDLSLLEVRSDDLNHALCFLHILIVYTADRYSTLVCDVDLHACALDNGVDCLSSLTNHITDLLRIDLDLDDLRSKFANRSTRCRNAFLNNLIEDILSCFLGTSDCFLYDLSCKTVDLNIHLDCSDTVMSSGYLEVHVAEEVLKTLDIGKNDIVIICITCNQTAGNTCNRFLDRYAGCLKGHSGRTDTCLGSRSVGLKSLGYCTNRIWEFLYAWKYRNKCSLSQCSMSDLTASRSSGRLGLTYRVGREVVMMHISLGCLELVKSVKSLSLCKRCQSRDGADLSLSTGKHSRAMYSRNDVNLCSQRTDLCDGTAVRTLVILEDHLANGLFLILVNRLAKNCKPLFFFCESLFQLVCDLCDVVLSCLLVIGEYRNLHLFRRNNLFDGVKQLLRNCAGLIAVLLFAALSNDLVEEFDDFLVYFVCLIDGFDHLILRNLIGTSLDHDNLVSCGSNGQLKVRNILLCQCRVHNELSINKTDLCSCAWTIKRNIGNAGCKGRTKHSRDLRIALRINGHNHVYQCDVISVILREQRTHRSVDNTRGKDRMLACLSLSLIETARDLSYGVHFLFIFNA